MTLGARWITACIPTFGCSTYLHAAVTSLLNQNYPYIRVIVINDGDPREPWAALEDIEDLRLIRFNLSENRGPYFANAIALEATPDSLFLVQDADDLSAPQRVSTLLHLLDRDRSSYAFSTLSQFRDHHSSGMIVEKPMFSSMPQLLPGPAFRHRMPHVGLFRAEALRAVGGYFGGFAFGYDTFLTNMILMAGSASWTPDELYWRRLRPTSLTQDRKTGMISDKRKRLRAEMCRMYQEIYRDYQDFQARRISGDYFMRLMRARVIGRCGARDQETIKRHASHLQHAMKTQGALTADRGRSVASYSPHIGRSLQHAR